MALRRGYVVQCNADSAKYVRIGGDSRYVSFQHRLIGTIGAYEVSNRFDSDLER